MFAGELPQARVFPLIPLCKLIFAIFVHMQYHLSLTVGCPYVEMKIFLFFKCPFCSVTDLIGQVFEYNVMIYKMIKSIHKYRCLVQN